MDLMEVEHRDFQKMEEDPFLKIQIYKIKINQKLKIKAKSLKLLH
jgi:hypothetical protein